MQYSIFKKVPDYQLLLYFGFYTALNYGGIFRWQKLLYMLVGMEPRLLTVV